MHRATLFAIIFCAGLMTPAPTLLAAEPELVVKSQDQIKEEIAALIRRLGSDEFQEREDAHRKLLQIGEAARQQILDAKKSKDPEVARRATVLLAELAKQHEARADVHVRGLYESRGRNAVVEVRETKKPVILVLCAYERVTWTIKASEGVEILRVIASGYHAQAVEGTSAPVEVYSYDQGTKGPDGRSYYFYTHDHDEENYPNMVAKVQQLTGKKPKSFEGRYGFKSVPFVVGGEE